MDAASLELSEDGMLYAVITSNGNTAATLLRQGFRLTAVDAEG